jgi:succinate-semialdehyde dehydrogenase / glutarate-semialdehyde dehydrogenase
VLDTAGDHCDVAGFHCSLLVANTKIHIITDIEPKNPLFSQETFGPVASVYVVETEDKAVALANATPFGLGSAIFSGDIDHARRVANRIESGMVFINRPTTSLPELPFGGVKNSGYGRELSELGFGEFTNRKLINAFPAERSIGVVSNDYLTTD